MFHPMSRTAALTLAVWGLVSWGCREPLDYERTLVADPDRGARLYKANCAKTCHPADVFADPRTSDIKELTNTVRAYYEQVVGGEGNYTTQDIFDLTRYLNDKYYQFDLPARY
ncbi:MAG: cytochrome c [Candidatus Sericytochromatia bacterium]|nr:cytochrome c [Candidatus Sericytochromatia bacterium]